VAVADAYSVVGLKQPREPRGLRGIGEARAATGAATVAAARGVSGA
jgi:hypothetical protein